MEKIKPHQRWRQALVIPRSLVQCGLMSPIQVLPGAPASTNLNPACHKYKTVSQTQESVTNTRKCHIYKTVSPCDVINISQIMSIPSLQQFFRVNGFFCISTREGCLCRGVLSSLSIESKGFLCDQSDVSCWTSRTLVFLLLFSICTFLAYIALVPQFVCNSIFAFVWNLRVMSPEGQVQTTYFSHCICISFVFVYQRNVSRWPGAVFSAICG